MRKCCYCGKTEDVEELRPYGPNFSDICFTCAMESPEREQQTKAMFTQLLDSCSSNKIVIGETTGPRDLNETEH